MKTYNKTTFITIYALLPFFANAQIEAQQSEWYISKDIQRINNKAYLQRLSGSELQIKSLNTLSGLFQKVFKKQKVQILGESTIPVMLRRDIRQG